MKRLILILLFCAAPAFAQGPIGGATAPPPSSDQFGANLVANPTFATSLASWTANACVTWDGTTTHTADGSGSAKAACTAGGTIYALEQAVAIGPTQDAELVTWWMKTDANFNGTVSAGVFDNTHGGGVLLGSTSRIMEQINAGSTSWVQMGADIYFNTLLHGNDGAFQIRLTIVGQTTGTAWIDDVSVTNEWNALHNFVTSTQENGYVWTDKAPVERNLAALGLDINHSPVAGQIAGIAEIKPSVGQTLSSVTLTETIDGTDATCTHPIGTKTFASPLATQVWSFAPADYGGIPALGTKYYVCAKLNVTSGGALIDAYPAFAVVFEGATFRAGLNNWFDGDDAWVHKGNRQFVIGAYDRLSSSYRCSNCLWSSGSGCSPNQSTAELCYLNDIQGPGRNNVAPASQVLGHGPGDVYTYAAQHFDLTLYFSPMSGVCPVASGICSGDQLSPWLDAVDSVGAGHMQIVDDYYHCLVSGTPPPCTAPTFTPTVTIGTGSITASTLDIEYTAVKAPIPSGSSGPLTQASETAPSTALSENLAAAGCAGVNCSVAFTTPACISTQQQGGFIYTSTDGVNYQRQYPTYTGQALNSYPIPCGQPITLSSLETTGITLASAAISSISRAGTTVTVTLSAPFQLVGGMCLAVAGVTDSADFPNINVYIGNPPNLTQFTYTQSGAATSSSGGTVTPTECTSTDPPFQSSTTTDSAVWNAFATTMANAAHPGGAGFYVADEPQLSALPTTFNIRQTLAPNANGMPLWCTLINSAGFNLWRDVCDVLNNDPYSYASPADPDDIAALPGSTVRTCNDYTATFNVISAASECFPQRVNIYVDAEERAVYGSRPIWTVLQLFARGQHLAFTYAETWRMAMEAIIGQKIWGTVGGIVWWGWVSSSGMERAWFQDQNKQALADVTRTDDQIHQLAPILMQPTEDSPILRATTGTVDGVSGITVLSGQVVSNVKVGTAVTTDCGAASAYANSTNYPFGPVSFATVTDAATGDEYIFANNLCDSSFNVTFTLPNVPAGQTNVEALYEGRTIALSGNTFTDTWGSGAPGTLDPHIYVIRNPRGAYIH